MKDSIDLLEPAGNRVHVSKSICLPPELLKKAEAKARAREQSFSALVRCAIRRELGIASN